MEEKPSVAIIRGAEKLAVFRLRIRRASCPRLRARRAVTAPGRRLDRYSRKEIALTRGQRA